MEDRRGTEPLDPRLGDSPLLSKDGGDLVVKETPSICVDLRRARLATGRELAEVSTVLRIQLKYLEALEEGRFDDLPGTTYATGFLRSYSEFLGIDPDEMVERLRRETVTDIDRHELSFPVPPKEGRNPKAWLILVVLAVAVLTYGGWHIYSTEGNVATEIVSGVSNTLTEAAGLSDDEAMLAEVAGAHVGGQEELLIASAPNSDVTAPEPAKKVSDITADSAPGTSVAPADSAATYDNAGLPAVSNAGETQNAAHEVTKKAIENEVLTSAVDANKEEAPAATTRSARALGSDSLWDTQAENSSSESMTIVEATGPKKMETAPIIRNANARTLDETNSEQVALESEISSESAREPSIFGEENTDFRVVITATGDSWVQIQGPDSELVLTRILRTGDVYRVPNRSGLLMVTGNAGALEVRVDGNLVGSLGPVGGVRRDVALDPDVLMANSITESQ